MSELYNEELKMAFLDRYENKSTRNTMINVFKWSAKTEKPLNRDLYEFTLNEIRLVLVDMNSSSIDSIRSNGRFISYYLDWIIGEGYKVNENPLNGLLNEWYENIYDSSKKTIFTEKEINEMEKALVNAQDAVVLKLLFEGVEGEGLSELLNLQEKDVNFDTGILSLRNDSGEKREIEVSEGSLNLIRQAIKNVPYALKNGLSEGKRREIEVVNNNYIVRSTIGRTINLDRADKHLIYRRLATMSEQFNYRYLTANNIVKSGKLKLAKDLYKDRKQLTNKELDIIAEQFGMKKTMTQGTYRYNSMRAYINEENIRGMYPEIFE
ncbi:site-specific integrase [Peribacillus loiseleuriae]|uniref:Tyr recombinase domain-containing protein n=1 Tax=Peribacillus loiseleuriae TaxID=1679170 RepID=A0A0K9GTP5_9BACI|nr:site-specific integrase [Peribacillus loiseleuriae]KMY49647.1 hypothetical protein AC625_08930 [Peribacillus loiseleuriae]